MSFVEVDAVSRAFHKRSLFSKTQSVHALSNVSLSIEEGQTYALVGESGVFQQTIFNIGNCVQR